jgi:hypothetical protein
MKVDPNEPDDVKHLCLVLAAFALALVAAVAAILLP